MTNSQKDAIDAISSIDGRYATKTEALSPFVSERALIEARLKVEAKWLMFLEKEIDSSVGFQLLPESKAFLDNLSKAPLQEAATLVKTLEATTNHDVKACEYYIKSELEKRNESPKALAYIHFACTSEDINNLSYGLMLKGTRDKVILPALKEIVANISSKASEYKSIPMLSRTHGQTASPTTLGKEFLVFSHRIGKVLDRLESIKIEGKINGAVGNFNAHISAFPELDWMSLSKRFVEDELGLSHNPITTQIENHDSMVELTESVRRANTILVGFCRDIWTYISIGYFSQKTVKGEVGSSTMPHKVNPIDFENAEGNLGVANSLAVHFSDKLPISRMQRDLTDSTVQRVLGTFFGHSLLAYKSLQKGLGKIVPRRDILAADLNSAVEVLAEPIQTVLRKYGAHDAYERLKEATRGQAITLEALHNLIDQSQELPSDEKTRLKELTPSSYTGIAEKIVDEFLR